MILAYVVVLSSRFPVVDRMPETKPLRHHPVMVGPDTPIDVELEIELSDPRELEALFHEALDTIARKHHTKRMLTIPPSL